MKQINSNEFRVYGGELYVSEDGFRRIVANANVDIPLAKLVTFANVVLEHFRNKHASEILTIEGTVCVNISAIMDHLDYELDMISLMFSRTFVKMFDEVGETLMIADTEEDLPYLHPSAAREYFSTLKILGKYLQIAEIWWKLQ